MNEYDKIVTDVISQIMLKELQPGDKLPTENDYVQNYNVSKMTVRKAFDKLKALGVIDTVQRKGSFVKHKSSSLNEAYDFSLGYSLVAILKGMVADVQILDFQIIEADENIADILKVEPNESLYYIKRLHYLDNVPSALEIIYIVKKDLPELEDELKLEETYDLLTKSKHTFVKNVSTRIEAIVPTSDLIETLALKDGEAVISITKLSKINEQNNFEYIVSFQAGSRINI